MRAVNERIMANGASTPTKASAIPVIFPRMQAVSKRPIVK